MWTEKTAPNSSERPSICHGGSTSSTSWPSERSSSTASATASAQSGSTVASAPAATSWPRSAAGWAAPVRGGDRERLVRGRSPRRVAELVAGEHVEDRGRVGDRAGQYPVDVQRRLAPLRRSGDASPRRLEADEPAARRGDPDRAAAVVAVRDRHHPRGDRRRRTARGAARCATQVPGVAGRPEQARLADGQNAVLRQRRGAHDHEARVPQAARDVGVVVGYVVGQQRAADRHPQAAHRPVVLDRGRNAREGPLVAGAHGVRGREGALGVHVHEGVQRGVKLLDAVQRALHQLARGDLSCAHHARELAR